MHETQTSLQRLYLPDEVVLAASSVELVDTGSGGGLGFLLLLTLENALLI